MSVPVSFSRTFRTAAVTATILWLTPTAIPAEQGMASWYGQPFHNQVAASGEVYDSAQMTAAHRTLPFGTNVRVRRIDNGEAVIVRINDRGPFVESRIIDVSEAAARRLGMTEPGIVQVAVEIVAKPATVASGAAAYGVQAGTFRNLDNARRMRDLLEKEVGAARIVVRPSAPNLWCVVAGRASSADDAAHIADLVRRRTGLRDAYVVRLDNAGAQVAD